jgi:ADP-heptose:LPS heptosyltransferase
VGVREIVRQDPFPTSDIHVIDYHLSLFPLRDRGEDRIPRIRIPELESQDVVAIHTGSGSAGKNWPRERYIQLAARLIERGERIAWIVGPAETGLEPFPGGDVWRSLTLPWLAARLARCRLYVGNDSGVTHLAAAAGCPTVALFGQSDPGVWAPRGVRVRILGAGSHGMRSIELEDVLRACEVFLKVK